MRYCCFSPILTANFALQQGKSSINRSMNFSFSMLKFQSFKFYVFDVKIVENNINLNVDNVFLSYAILKMKIFH